MARFMPNSNLPAPESLANYGFMAGYEHIFTDYHTWQVYFNDFLDPGGGTIADSADVDGAWIVTDHGTNTADTAITGNSETLAGNSLMQILCDATDNEGAMVQSGQESVWAVAGRTILFDAYVGVGDVNDMDIFVGIAELDTSFSDANGILSMANAAGFQILQTTTDGVVKSAYAGADGSLVNAGTAGTMTDCTITAGALTNFVRMSLVITGTDTITWYWNGVQVQTATAASAFDTPSAISFNCIGGGDTADTLYIDYVMLAQTR